MRLLAVGSAMFAIATTPVPHVLERIAQCETGSNWSHATRDFISAFGIRRSSWNEYLPDGVSPVPTRRRAGERIPTRQEQVAVAVNIARKAGLTAWQCFREHRREWGQ